MLEELIVFRKDLHQHPELSGHEEKTAEKIKIQLIKTSPTTLTEKIGGHGIAATFDYLKEGKHILFRADMDALPIQEINRFPHRSKNKGVSHKCGHDGHSTILVGLAQRLQKYPLHSGKVTLLFQPAEETGEGAKAVLNDSKFEQIKPDFAFALHNIPSYPKGQILCKSGSFNPSVISFIIRLKGKKAHAAQSENGINPAIAITSIINEVNQLNNFNLQDEKYLKATAIHVSLGSKDYGISASQAELHYTIRCKDEEKLDSAKKRIATIAQIISEDCKLKYSIEWLHHFASSINHPEAVAHIKKVASNNHYDYTEMLTPFEWGEDFGLFTKSIPGAMFGLGAGIDTPELHQEDYDFPDDIIKYGVNMFYGIAKEICG